MKSLATLVVLLLIWAAGLSAFADRVDDYAPAADPAAADGIVALTGASDDRIETAMRLLEGEKGSRMLVSGVNKDATREDIRSVTRGFGALFDCCVDLDYEAESTLGNAQFTAQWARSHRFDSLIVVTSDHHMPRSLLELKAALPGARLIPHAIETELVKDARWWRTREGAERMVLEYSKYLTVLFRELVLSIGDDKPKPPARPPAEAGGSIRIEPGE